MFQHVEKCLQKSVNKNTCLKTFETCWNVTTKQIILKDKGDIDALCATDRSRK